MSNSEVSILKLTVGGNILLHDARQTVLVLLWIGHSSSRHGTVHGWYRDFKLN